MALLLQSSTAVGVLAQGFATTGAKVTIGIYDGSEPISSVATITLDSTTPQMNEDWKKEVWLTLVSRAFKKTDRYNLIVRNTADDTEVVRQDVVIDLAFTNDF